MVLIRYEAGDHVAVFPSNDEALVKRIGELLNADLDEVISLINVDGKFFKILMFFSFQ
jgi:NADPH-ferrihemoprotein reductase